MKRVGDPIIREEERQKSQKAPQLVKILIKIGEPVEKNGELCVAHRAMCTTLLYVLIKKEACTS